MSHRNIALALCLALAGCEARVPQVAPTSPSTPQRVPAVGAWQNIERFGPDEHGVTCYRFIGWQTLSCVKVK